MHAGGEPQLRQGAGCGRGTVPGWALRPDSPRGSGGPFPAGPARAWGPRTRGAPASGATCAAWERARGGPGASSEGAGTRALRSPPPGSPARLSGQTGGPRDRQPPPLRGTSDEQLQTKLKTGRKVGAPCSHGPGRGAPREGVESSGRGLASQSPHPCPGGERQMGQKGSFYPPPSAPEQVCDLNK